MKTNITSENMMKQLDKLQERFEQGQLMLTTILTTMNEQMAMMEQMVKNIGINTKQRAENIDAKISEEMSTIGHRLENIESKVNELEMTRHSTLEFFDDQPVDDAAPKRKKIKNNGSNVVDQEADGENRWRNYIKSMDIGGVKMFECTVCHKTSVYSSSLKFHINAQHVGVTYACPHCDYTPSHKSILKRHIQEVHYKVRHQCPHCDYTGSRITVVRNHMVQVHHITNPEQKAMN